MVAFLSRREHSFKPEGQQVPAWLLHGVKAQATFMWLNEASRIALPSSKVFAVTWKMYHFDQLQREEVSCSSLGGVFPFSLFCDLEVFPSPHPRSGLAMHPGPSQHAHSSWAKVWNHKFVGFYLQLMSKKAKEKGKKSQVFLGFLVAPTQLPTSGPAGILDELQNDLQQWALSWYCMKSNKPSCVCVVIV